MDRSQVDGGVADGDLVRSDDPIAVQVPIAQQRTRPDTVHRIAHATLDRVEAAERCESGHTRRQLEHLAVVGRSADAEVECRVPPAQHLDVDRSLDAAVPDAPDVLLLRVDPDRLGELHIDERVAAMARVIGRLERHAAVPQLRIEPTFELRLPLRLQVRICERDQVRPVLDLPVDEPVQNPQLRDLGGRAGLHARRAKGGAKA